MLDAAGEGTRLANGEPFLGMLRSSKLPNPDIILPARLASPSAILDVPT